MEYKRFNNTIVARIDKDEEIVAELHNIAIKENIKLASVLAIGAVSSFEAGVYKLSEKKYYKNEFVGDFEIISLMGNINTKNSEVYTHLHITCSNVKGQTFGGHLNKAFVSTTCEMIINIIDGCVDRFYDEEIGVNLFKF